MGMMPAKLGTMETERRNDINNVLIIIGVALGLGVYLAATTVVISKDGVGYIEQARQFSTDPGSSLTTHHPGYPLLIFAVHKLVSLFMDESSVLTWIYSAQGMTLFFQLLALIPLYFTGKWLVGSNKSFYAVLILVVLPNPAKMGCEVMREWPYMFFLAAGFLFLLWGARRGALWTFGLAGLSSGLGYWIRPECGQIVVYGLTWLILGIFRPAVAKMTRWKSFAASALLLIGFAFPALPYAKYTGNLISPNAERVIRLLSNGAATDNADLPGDETGATNHYTAGLVWRSVQEALGEVFRTTGENTMWFFLPFLFAGFFYRMRCSAGFEERFLLSIFILMNLAMMVARYCYIEAHISNRWTLPLVAFTIFYAPAGLQIAAQWLENRLTLRATTNGKPRLFLTLFLIGTAICLPKLLRPAGYDKRSFRAAATWLNENTREKDTVAVPDTRISFYAEREGLMYKESIPEEAKFIVRIMEVDDEGHDLSPEVREEFSLSSDERRKAKRIVIYRVL